MGTKSKFLIVGLALITVVAISVTVWALFFRENQTVILTPDYAPKEEEINIEAIPNDSGEKIQSEEGGGGVSLTYSTDVIIDLSDKKAYLYFANPGKSNQNMVLQIAISDEVIVQSGTIVPGFRVSELDLLSGSEKMLSEGGYDGKFVVLFYNPESGEKAMVNTEIPIEISVRK